VQNHEGAPISVGATNRVIEPMPSIDIQDQVEERFRLALRFPRAAQHDKGTVLVFASLKGRSFTKPLRDRAVV
jgi:hypothetical protein